MASWYEAVVTVTSAGNLKNVSWQNGKIKPYVVVSTDSDEKYYTLVDNEGDTFPYWDQQFTIPLDSTIEDSTLYIDIFHADAREDMGMPSTPIGYTKLLLLDVVNSVGLGSLADMKLELKRPSGRPHGTVDVKVSVLRKTHYRAAHHADAREGTKPRIGSAKLHIRDVLADVGLGSMADRKHEPKRPSRRPHGKVDVKVSGRETRYRAAQDPYTAPPYGVPPSGSRYYAPPAECGNPYGAPAPPAYGPPARYPSYGQPSYEQPTGYGRPASYGQPSGYGQGSYNGQAPPVKAKKQSKFRVMETGLAVGALAGFLGGIALRKGVNALEDLIADEAAERVEDDEGYDLRWG